MSLNASTSTGADGISATILKGCAMSITSSITSIFNLSLSTGIVPSDWKIAQITPIHKKHNRSEVNNYCPISLLSLVGKVLERLVHSALFNHVLNFDVLSINQFGFRLSSSTQEALLYLTNCWHHTLERKGYNICDFLDLAKAFDSIRHDLVVNSLALADVSGNLLSWFQSYLTNRQQFVAIPGGSSSSITSSIRRSTRLNFGSSPHSTSFQRNFFY